MAFLSICTALYDYTPQSEGELQLEEGDLVYILEKSIEDDWWKAKKRALSEDEEEPIGLIPNNYVEEAKPTHHAKSLYDYSRQTDEELSFAGDAVLAVYDNNSDPEWTLVGLDGEFGFVPANYIEITGEAAHGLPSPPPSEPTSPLHEDFNRPSPEHAKSASDGPAAAIAGIMHGKTTSTSSAANPTPPARQPQLTPETSDEDVPPPSLPQRPRSEQLSPPPTQSATPQAVTSPGIAASPPHNRAVHQEHVEDSAPPHSGGFHLYNISEMVSAMGKSKKLPTTLGLNLATGKIMIAPEKNRDGPTIEWTAEKLTHYSIEGKHVFIELVRPSRSIDFHAGAKDTAQEIVAGLGEIAGAARAEGLREVLEAAGTGTQKRGKMLYEFMAQGDDEVTVAVDDEVVVIDDTQSDEWWMVRRVKNNKEGVVPSSYVEVTGTVAPPPSKGGVNAGRSVVEQNRLEEERLTKEAVKSSRGTEVGPGVKLPERGSSLTSGLDNQAPQRSKRESKHGRTSSSAKTKPETTKVRVWTDRSRAFKVEAQFLGLKDGKIHLHKLNGVKIAVPVAKMDIKDLEYVESVTGQSLDDDKPLSDIKRKGTAKAASKASKPGASIEQPKPPPKEEPEYDWFDFFLKCGVDPYRCERYSGNFKKDAMDETVLADISPAVLRTLGLNEGDILRVTKYLDVKYNRNTADRGGSPDPNSGGLFSGPGGALRNNTRKGRPAPAVESKDVIDQNAFKPKALDDTSDAGPPPPKKDRPGFDDDAWDVKPTKQQTTSQQSVPSTTKAVTESATNTQAKQLSGSLLDLSLLSPPLKPTQASQDTGQQPQQPQQPQDSQSVPQQIQMQQPQQQQSPPPQMPQITGANPQFFSQLQQGSTPGTSSLQQSMNQQNQQLGPPRQRPQAPPSVPQGSLVPPPPTRPLSAPQSQQPNPSFGPPPLQPQLTGFQPATQIAPPGQSLNDLNQQRFQQQQQQQPYNQQPFNQQQLLTQQTGFLPQSPQNFGTRPGTILPQQTGYTQNPYVNGQMMGSPFADPRLQPQQTGYQTVQPQYTGFQLQPQQTGINSMLPLALQPQQTGMGVNGFQPQTGFAQSPPPVPPVPSLPQQQQPSAAPLQPQKTGPAPPVRFGTQAANKLVPQPTGKKANLSNATPSNPFGF